MSTAFRFCCNVLTATIKMNIIIIIIMIIAVMLTCPVVHRFTAWWVVSWLISSLEWTSGLAWQILNEHSRCFLWQWQHEPAQEGLAYCEQFQRSDNGQWNIFLLCRFSSWTFTSMLLNAACLRRPSVYLYEYRIRRWIKQRRCCQTLLLFSVCNDRLTVKNSWPSLSCSSSLKMFYPLSKVVHKHLHSACVIASTSIYLW